METMKKQLTVRSMLSRVALCAAVAGLALLGTALRSSAGETVIPPSDLPYGLSYEEWSAKWWQWYMGLETNHIENVGSPDICSGPASHVRFLYGAPATTTVTGHVEIGPDTPIFFAILGFIADNTACPVSDFGTNTSAQLGAEVEGAWTNVTVTTCTIDGVAVEGLDNPFTSIYDIVSPPFSYTIAEKNSIISLVEGEDCLPGGMTIYPAVAEGVYLMLAPLKPGKHKISFVGVYGPVSSPNLKLDITYDIAVLP
jgi:hypothetical protein